MTQSSLVLGALGIFNNETCQQSLLVIEGLRRSIIREATQKGYMDSEEVKEYIQRQKRVYYLYEQAHHASNEAAVARKLFMMDLEYVTRPAKGPGSGLFKALVMAKKPHTPEERVQVINLMNLRASIAFQRAFYSREFLELKPMVRLELLPKEVFREAASRAETELIRSTPITETRILVETLHEFVSYFKNFGPTERAQRLEQYQKRIKTLLEAEAVPLPVKEEIEVTLNFNEKYDLPLHPLFESYLDGVAKYLGIM